MCHSDNIGTVPACRRVVITTCAAALLLGLVASSGHGVEPVNFHRLADAIYRAEGGAATRHPYGIMFKYQHTTPRSACLNTISRNHSEWMRSGHHGDFIVYLGAKYCPNDAAHWSAMVKSIYSKAQQSGP